MANNYNQFRQNLYEGLSQHFELPTADVFNQDMNDPAKRKQFYQAYGRYLGDVKDLNHFETLIAPQVSDDNANKFIQDKAAEWQAYDQSHPEPQAAPAAKSSPIVPEQPLPEVAPNAQENTPEQIAQPPAATGSTISPFAQDKQAYQSPLARELAERKAYSQKTGSTPIIDATGMMTNALAQDQAYNQSLQGQQDAAQKIAQDRADRNNHTVYHAARINALNDELLSIGKMKPEAITPEIQAYADHVKAELGKYGADVINAAIKQGTENKAKDYARQRFADLDASIAQKYGAINPAIGNGAPSSFAPDGTPMYERDPQTGAAMFQMPVKEITADAQAGTFNAGTPEERSALSQAQVSSAINNPQPASQTQQLAERAQQIKSDDAKYDALNESLTAPFAASKSVAQSIIKFGEAGNKLYRNIQADPQHWNKTENVRALSDMGLSAFSGAMAALPEVAGWQAASAMVMPAAQGMGQAIGGEKGKQIAETVVNYGTTMPFGWKVLVGAIASDGGKYALGHALNNTALGAGIPQEDKERLIEGAGHLAFFGTLLMAEGAAEGAKQLAQDKLSDFSKTSEVVGQHTPLEYMSNLVQSYSKPQIEGMFKRVQNGSASEFDKQTVENVRKIKEAADNGTLQSDEGNTVVAHMKDTETRTAHDGIPKWLSDLAELNSEESSSRYVVGREQGDPRAQRLADGSERLRLPAGINEATSDLPPLDVQTGEPAKADPSNPSLITPEEYQKKNAKHAVDPANPAIITPEEYQKKYAPQRQEAPAPEKKVETVKVARPIAEGGEALDENGEKVKVVSINKDQAVIDYGNNDYEQVDLDTLKPVMVDAPKWIGDAVNPKSDAPAPVGNSALSGDAAPIENTQKSKVDEPIKEDSAAPAPEESKSLSVDERVAKSAELGKKAFEDGLTRAPAQNPEWTKLTEGLQIGEGGANIADAYLKAWDKANLEAPVDANGKKKSAIDLVNSDKTKTEGGDSNEAVSNPHVQETEKEVSTQQGAGDVKQPAPVNPWVGSSVKQESNWHGTPVHVSAGKDANAYPAYNGKVVRVLNGGSLVEVQKDGSPSVWRVDNERVSLMQPESKTEQAITPVSETQQTAPAGKPKAADLVKEPEPDLSAAKNKSFAEKLYSTYMDEYLAHPSWATATDAKKEQIRRTSLDRAVGYANNIHDAIENRDEQKLLDSMHTGNKMTRKAFTDQTGIKLPTTNKGTIEAIKKYVADKPVATAQPEETPAQTPELPTPTGTKEPWQQTRHEYADSFADKDSIAIYNAAHPRLVKNAIESGKSVPENVLAGYRHNGWAQNAIDRLYPNSEYATKPTQPQSDATPTPIEEPKKNTYFNSEGEKPQEPKAETEQEKLEREFKESAEAFMKTLGQLNSGLDPEQIAAGAKMVGAGIKLGHFKFRDLLQKLMQMFPHDLIRKIIDGIKTAYGAHWMNADKETRAKMSSMDEVADFDIEQLIKEVNDASSVAEQGKGALERIPADDVQTIQGRGNSGSEGVGSGTENVGGDAPTHGSGVSSTSGVADGNGESHPSSGGSGGDGAAGSGSGKGKRGTLPAEQPDEQRSPENTESGSDGSGSVRGGLRGTGENYVITDADHLGQGSLGVKYANNIAAIRLLKLLQKENRQATPQEQSVLAQYVGWGGLSTVFPRTDGSFPKGPWAQRHEELKGLLTKQEYDAAASSTQNAHYTAEPVVRAIYDILKRLGFNGGKFLESSMGVGNFFGLMPLDMRGTSELTGVERDHITGGIAKQLYPKANILAPLGFQDAPIADGYFDASAGNPPFGSETILNGKSKHLKGYSIHNYFFARTVDKLRAGGVMSAVITNSFLDKAGEKERNYIADRVKFIGAIRLPNTAFQGNANTSVVTDIVILQKLPESEYGTADKSWVGTTTIPDPLGSKDIPINNYYAAHPEMLLGRMERSDKMLPAKDGTRRPTLAPIDGAKIEDQLSAAIKNLPENIYQHTTTVTSPEKMAEESIHAPDDAAEKEIDYYFTPKDKKDAVYQRIVSDDGSVKVQEVTAETLWGEKQKWGKNRIDRLRSMLPIRDAVLTQYRLERSDASDKEIEANRKKLNKLYDDFVKKFGFLHQTGNAQVIDDDKISLPILMSLEEDYEKGITKERAKALKINEVEATAEKADIFRKRLLSPERRATHAETPSDGLNITLAEDGKVDLDRIAQLTGKTKDEVISELSGGDDPLIYHDPDLNDYVLKDEYLSGNVKGKAKLAEAAGLMRNAEALRAVFPKDAGVANVRIQLKTPWVKPSYYEQFARELLGEGTRAQVVFLPSFGGFKVSISAGNQTANRTTYGNRALDAGDLIDRIMNSKEISVKVRQFDGSYKTDVDATADAQLKAARIMEEFEKWIYKDLDRREDLLKYYNDNINVNVKPKISGSHLTYQGKVPDSVIKFNPHQNDAIWRIVRSNVPTLLDHVVGSGKTFTMVAAAMELKRLGLAKKPMIVVPNHLINQWAEEWYKIYPSAKILAMKKKDFEKGRRRETFARIASGDWDAVIVAHSSFGFIPVDRQLEIDHIEGEIADIEATIDAMREANSQDSRTIKQLQKSIDKRREKMMQLINTPKDNVLTFEEMGVDQLFVDEAHEFKNLFFTTQNRNGRGFGNPNGSQKAMQLYIKTKYLVKKRGGRGVVFATGTPISNSLVEMYTMQRYLGGAELERQKIKAFDTWLNTYGAVETDYELDGTGVKYKAISRLRNLQNMPTLMASVNQFQDSVTNDQVKAQFMANKGYEYPIPKIDGGKPQNVVVPITAFQEAYFKEIVHRAEHLDPKDRTDNMLRITMDARKAALDMRIIYPRIPDNPQSKVNICANNILDTYKQWNKKKGTQLVFLDLSIPKSHAADEFKKINELIKKAESDNEEVAEEAQKKLEKYTQDDIEAAKSVLSGFSVYDDLREKLIDRGIPAKEIAYIHDAKTEKQKEDLFDSVNAGRIRVLIGSTSKMGAGMNVQKKLVGLHHLDCPWRPSDIEQREGRIIRQGNELYAENPEGFRIKIHRYSTKATYDARMWQVQEQKATGIEGVRNYEGQDTMDDVAAAAATAAEMKAEASGNPLILEDVQLAAKIKKMQAAEKAAQNERYDYESKLKRYTDVIDSAPMRLPALERDAKTAEKYNADPIQGNFTTGTIDGKEYKNISDARDAAERSIQQQAEAQGITKEYVDDHTKRKSEAQVALTYKNWETFLATKGIKKDEIESNSKAKKDALKEFYSWLETDDAEKLKFEPLKRAKWKVNFNGIDFTSRETLMAALEKHYPIGEPFSMTFNGKVENSIGKAKSAVTDWLREQMRTGGYGKTTKVGKVGDFDIFITMPKSDEGNLAITIKGAEDHTIKPMFIPSSPESMGKETVERIMKMMQSGMWSEETTLRNQLKNAQNDIENVKERLNGNGFSGAEQLEEFKKRHAEVRRQLSDQSKNGGTTGDEIDTSILNPYREKQSSGSTDPKKSFYRMIKTGFERVPNAEPITLDGVPNEFYVYVNTDKDVKPESAWTVNEAKSGLALGHGETAEEAIAQAQDRLTQNIYRFPQLIEDAIKKSGISPRYADDNTTRRSMRASDIVSNPKGLIPSNPDVPKMQKDVGELTRWMSNAPDVQVVGSEHELPSDMDATANSGTEAIYWQKRDGRDGVIIVADKIKDKSRLQEVLLHEIVGHYGLRKTLGESFGKTLDAVWNDLAPKIRSTSWYRTYASDPDYNPNTKEGRRNLAEEYIAHEAEKGVEPRLWDKIVAAFRSALRAMGLKLKLTTADIRKIIADSKKYVRGDKEPDPNDGGGKSVIRHLYGGEGATNYDAAEQAGRTFQSPFDLMNRMEIDDSGAKLLQRSNGDLEEVLHHPKLFREYPDTKSIQVRFEDMPASKGGNLDIANNTINLNKNITDENKTLSSLIHEVQHALQYMEGFNKGGSITSLLKPNMTPEDIQNLHDTINFYEQSKASAQSSGLWYSSDPMLRRQWINNYNLMKGAADQLKKGESAYKAYLRIAGENEAKDTEARLKLTDVERAATPPYSHVPDLSTESLQPEDAIVQLDGQALPYKQDVFDNILHSKVVDPNSKVYGEENAALLSSGFWDRKIEGIKDTAHKGRRMYQDHLLDLKELQDRIEAEGRTIGDEENPYQKETLSYGKIETRLHAFERDKYLPLLKTIDAARKSSGITLDDVHYYLYAKHALERNAYIADQNQKVIDSLSNRLSTESDPIKSGKIRDRLDELSAGSGMSDDSAQQIIDDMTTAGKAHDLELVAQRIYDINKFDLKNRLDSGLLSQEQYDDLSHRYKYYVPLRGFEEDDGSRKSIEATGKGYDTRGKEYKAAQGRRSMADDVISYTIQQAEGGIIRSEKNAVQQALYNLMVAHPTKDLQPIKHYYVAEAEIGTGKPIIDEDTGRQVFKIVTKRPAKSMFESGAAQYHLDEHRQMVDNYDTKGLESDDVIGLKIDGKAAFIKCANPDLARAMKKMNIEQAEWFTNLSGRFVAAYRKMATQYNPEFALSNLIRDAGEAIFYLNSEVGKGSSTAVISHIPHAMSGLRAQMKGDLSSDWAKAAQEFFDEGASTGFWNMKTVEQRTKDLVKALDPSVMQQVGHKAHAVLDFIDDVNRVVENGIRLSAYYHLTRILGWTKQKAAAYAKNMTINFNRHGEKGNTLSKLYVFFNAQIQGTAKLVQTMFSKNPKIRRRALGQAALIFGLSGLFQELMRQLMGMDEDDKYRYDKINPWTRNHKIVIPNFASDDPNDYFTCPLPYGLNFIWAAGGSLGDIAHGEFGFKSAMSLAGAAADAFSPYGAAESKSTSGTMLKTFAPTFAKPALEIALNEDYAGKPIRPTGNPFSKYQRPESEQYFSSVNPVFKNISESMNTATGGDKIDAGWASISPEYLEYLTEYYTAGVGRFVTGTVNTAAQVIDPQAEVETGRAPFIRLFSGKLSNAPDNELYRNNAGAYEQARDKVKQYEKDGDEVGKDQAEARYQPLLDLKDDYSATEKKLRELTKEQREETDQRRIKEIEAEKVSLKKQFNRSYKYAIEMLK